MKAKWLLEEGFFWEGQLDNISPVLKKMDVEYKLTNQRHELDFQKYFVKEDCVIAYGSIEFVQEVRNRTSWIPGVWFDPKMFKCSMYYSYFGNYALNSQYILLPLEELKRQKDYIFRLFGDKDGEIFIRPDSSLKEFTGHVAHYDDFEQKLQRMSYGKLEKHLLVMVSKVTSVQEEYRFIVANRKILDGCIYMFNGQHDEREGYPQEAYDLCQRIADEEWRPASVFVVDICKSNDKYYLMEINAFNSSGNYRLNLEKIVPVVNKIAEDEAEAIEAGIRR